MQFLKIILLTLLSVLLSCVSDPTVPNLQSEFEIKPSSVLVLCEGLLGYNNSSITLINIEENKLSNSIFEKVNLHPLGDIANNVLKSEGYYFVLTSSSRTLYKIDKNTLKVIKSTTFSGNSLPRKMALNNNVIYITDAYQNCIHKVEKNSLNYLNSIKVGAQPEGIVIFNNMIYVVNSGWGDINKNHPQANYLYKIDIISENLVASIQTDKNPVELICDTINSNIYLTYYNLPSLPDSTGGIVKYDSQLNELSRVNGNFIRTKFSDRSNILYAINDNTPGKNNQNKSGIVEINMNSKSVETLVLNKQKQEFWYNFEIHPESKMLWVCNAKNFQNTGEIMIYDNWKINESSEIILSFPTGINPNKIIF
jgi:glutamine cyclotransferase